MLEIKGIDEFSKAKGIDFKDVEIEEEERKGEEIILLEKKYGIKILREIFHILPIWIS